MKTLMMVHRMVLLTSELYQAVTKDQDKECYSCFGIVVHKYKET